MRVRGQGLAAGTEIGVVADRAFVAISANGKWLVLAERSVAVNGLVNRRPRVRATYHLVNGHKPVTRMTVTSILHTSRAVVPIWAHQAFVTYSVDGLFSVSHGFSWGQRSLGLVELSYLVTAVANGKVLHVSTRSTKEGGHTIQGSLFSNWCKFVARMMAVLQAHVTRDAEIIVIAYQAGDKVGIFESFIKVSHEPKVIEE